MKLELRADDYQAGDLRQIGDNVFADAVGEVLLFRVARHIGERQNGNRGRLDTRRWIGGIRPTDGGIHLTGVPLPDLDRAVDVLDTYGAAILEANVDPVADALVDDRGNARLDRVLQAAPSARQY